MGAVPSKEQSDNRIPIDPNDRIKDLERRVNELEKQKKKEQEEKDKYRYKPSEVGKFF